VKLWKVSERRKRTDGFNLRDEMGSPVDPSSITSLRVPVFKPMELMVEASPRRVFANAHTYHINSISVNSDGATYLSADDLRINLWHMENNDQSFSILLALMLEFLRTTAYIYSAYIRRICYHPSVRPSVTGVDHSKTVEVGIMQFSP